MDKAVKIFSCLSSDHPISWVVHYTNGTFCEKKKKYEEASAMFSNCLEMAKNKFDSSHITIKKVRLRIAKSLMLQDKVEESFNLLEELEEET